MTMQELAYAFSEPVISASYKIKPEDFRVSENLNFEPDGEGDHLFLLVEKTGLSTRDVQKLLMDLFKLPERDVSFSGMKDKQAVSRQWFSIKPREKTEALIDNFDSEHLKLCRIHRNKRKLKRGSHVSNNFIIRLSDLSDDPVKLDERLQLIAKHGVPNYFGEQRFGNNADNVQMARQFFSGELRLSDRYRRGIYLSAARAYLFNRVLSQRVEQQSWNAYIPGDVMSLDASSACFLPDSWNEVLAERLQQKDIHPSGPLWGAGKLKSQAQCAAMEMDLISSERDLKTGLESAGLEQQRRALRSVPGQLTYRIENKTALVLEFSLNKGSYATSLLRELVKLRPHSSTQENQPDTEEHATP
tara:strand:- start:161441 stop:162517 length:1077 start_codon:yes stop_codon:yes gene_type:complete